VSVSELFIAAIVPALLMTALLCIAVYFNCMRKKELIVSKSYTWHQRLNIVIKAVPVATIPFAIMGSLYAGICTPTESAGIGCLVALLLAKFYFRRFGLQDAKQCLKETAKSTGIIFLIIIGAVIFGKVLALLQIPQMFGQYIVELGLGLNPFKFAFFLLFFLMGFVFDALILMLVALPPLVGALTGYGLALVPFGVMFELIVNLGQVTPPVALVLYSAAATTKAPIDAVIREAPPYIATWIAGTLLVLFIPALASVY